MEVPNVILAQAVELPDLSGLPPFAQGVLYTVFFLGVALSVVVPRMGFLHGKHDAKKADNPSVAAVIVDPSALNAHTAATNRVADVLEKMVGGLDEVREEIRLTREVSRSRTRGS